MNDIIQRGIFSGHHLDYRSSSSHLSDSLADSAVLPVFADTRYPQRTAIQPIDFVIVNSVLPSSDNNYANIYRERVCLCQQFVATLQQTVEFSVFASRLGRRRRTGAYTKRCR